jgi:hypothetical protein
MPQEIVEDLIRSAVSEENEKLLDEEYRGKGMTLDEKRRYAAIVASMNSVHAKVMRALKKALGDEFIPIPFSRPTPDQFGLTQRDVDALKEWDLQLRKRVVRALWIGFPATIDLGAMTQKSNPSRIRA